MLALPTYALFQSVIGSFSDYLLDITHIGPPKGNGPIVAATSRNVIKVYDYHSFQLSLELSGHSARINQLSSRSDDQAPIWQLLSCGSDGTVRLWDLREPSIKGGHILGHQKKEVIFSCDINSNGSLVAAGGESGKVYLWDIRKQPHPRDNYEIHSLEISRVKFNPGGSEPNTLLTAGADLLVNVFDSSQTQEDDALLMVLPIEQTANHITFCNEQHVAITTQTEQLSIWNYESGECVKQFGDVRSGSSLYPESDPILYSVHWAQSDEQSFSPDSMSVDDEQVDQVFSGTQSQPPFGSQRGTNKSLIARQDDERNPDALDYIVDCLWDNSTQDLFVIGGSIAGVIHLLKASETVDGLIPIQSLKNGHSSSIRSAFWSPESHVLITCGEEGKVCSWRSTFQNSPSFEDSDGSMGRSSDESSGERSESVERVKRNRKLEGLPGRPY